jgi:hypothetical protein
MKKILAAVVLAGLLASGSTVATVAQETPTAACVSAIGTMLGYYPADPTAQSLATAVLGVDGVASVSIPAVTGTAPSLDSLIGTVVTACAVSADQLALLDIEPGAIGATTTTEFGGPGSSGGPTIDLGDEGEEPGTPS